MTTHTTTPANEEPEKDFLPMTNNNNPLSLPPRPQTKEDFEALGGRTADSRVGINTGGFASVTFENGNPVLGHGKNYTEFTPNHDPSFVSINGMSVKRETYHTLLETGTLPKDAKIIDRAPHLSKEFTRPFGDGSEGDANLIADDTSGQRSEKTEEKPSEADPTEDVFREGDEAIAQAASAIGREAVQEAIQNAAVTGELTPPPGVSEAQVNKVVAGYIASAAEMVSHVGISVGDLTHALDDSELQDCRLAVVSGNVQRVQELAGRAVDALASMPVKNPDFFAYYIGNKFPDLDWKMEQGRALVMVEGSGYTSWDQIVRSGWLSKAKAVPSKDDGE